jgi:hypothetical protein
VASEGRKEEKGRGIAPHRNVRTTFRQGHIRPLWGAGGWGMIRPTKEEIRWWS